jgi:hypothetical protein
MMIAMWSVFGSGFAELLKELGDIKYWVKKKEGALSGPYRAG